jgi:2-polyprenyl-6-methoxyphenol hydroxylase-like FAD-dependent oxidoreductase
VYERDDGARGRQQGYRLRISPEGEQALKDCLPDRNLRLMAATSALRRESGMTAFDENLVEQWAPSIEDPRPDSPDKIDAVDRATFRRVLLAGLEDVVWFGKRFLRYDHTPDGPVTAHFADGTDDTGDVLVAADGTNSRVRARLRPWDEPGDLGVRTVFSRIPMDRAFRDGLSEVLRDRFTYVLGSDGHHVGLMPMVFRNRPPEAAAQLWPEVTLDAAEDYFLGVFNVHREDLKLADGDFFALSGARLVEFVLDSTRGWHPVLSDVFAHADPDATFAVPLRATTPVQAWEPGPVVGLGDAVHTMPPSGGVGANSALRDAGSLCRALSEVARGERDLPDAFADYQDEMVRCAEESVGMSLRIAQWSMRKVDIEPTGLTGSPRSKP